MAASTPLTCMPKPFLKLGQAGAGRQHAEGSARGAELVRLGSEPTLAGVASQ